MTEKVRKEFEEWARGDVDLNIDALLDGGYYKDVQTAIAWDAWQASRASLVVKLPKQWLDQSMDCDLMEAHLVAKALDNAGVKYE